MNSQLLEIAKYNSYAVAQYQRGDNQRAVSALLDGLKMLPCNITSIDRDNNNEEITQCQKINNESNSKRVIRHDTQQTSLQVSNNNNMEPNPIININNQKSIKILDEPILDIQWTYEDANFLSGNIISPLSSRIYSVQPIRDTRITNKELDMYNGIYNGAFLLANDIPIAIPETVGVLSYNLGLIFHREGVQQGRTSILYKALRLYERSLSILNNSQMNILNHSSMVIVALTAAICCNMAHIYSLFSIKPNGIDDRLAQLVTCLEGETTISQEDKEFFQLSVYFLKSASLNAAPAA